MFLVSDRHSPAVRKAGAVRVQDPPAQGKNVIGLVYEEAELPLWCQDGAVPYQAIP